MTYWGTNTFLVEDGEGLIVLDPGPASDPLHLEDIVREAEGRITAILLSHGHSDHYGLVNALRKRTGAPVHAYGHTLAADTVLDVRLSNLDRVGPLLALHTPGHAPDHLCFARDDGLLFTADHVMGWSSSVVSPPTGSMADYVASLDLLIERNDLIYLPGHGPAIREPKGYVTELRHRRLLREQEILRALQQRALTTGHISSSLYRKPDSVLRQAAERNVLAHLLKLQSEGRVRQREEFWFATG